MSTIKVSIVADDAPSAESLSRILHGTPGFCCLSTHASGEDALADLPFGDVDVVLMDLSLPGMGGGECIRRLRQRSEKPLFMVLTVWEDHEKIFESLKAGASGYLLKKTPPAEILEAIVELSRGGSPMSPAIARKVTRFFHSNPSTAGELDELTDREREVLHHLSQAHSNKEIAARLHISCDTVRNHLRKIYEKLHVRSRAAATAKYLGR